MADKAHESLPDTVTGAKFRELCQKRALAPAHVTRKSEGLATGDPRQLAHRVPNELLAKAYNATQSKAQKLQLVRMGYSKANIFPSAHNGTHGDQERALKNDFGAKGWKGTMMVTALYKFHRSDDVDDATLALLLDTISAESNALEDQVAGLKKSVFRAPKTMRAIDRAQDARAQRRSPPTTAKGTPDKRYAVNKKAAAREAKADKARARHAKKKESAAVKKESAAVKKESAAVKKETASKARRGPTEHQSPNKADRGRASRAGSRPGEVSVAGYTRSDGTEVASYTRAAPSPAKASTPSAGSGGRSIHVSGYTRSDGTRVAGYTRSASSSSRSSGCSSSAGSVSVSGYTRSNGTHVAGYTRSAPSSSSCGSYGGSYSSGTVSVSGYTRSNGTYVSGYTRRK